MESKLTATCNLSNREWKVLGDFVPARDMQINIGFNRDGQTALEFNDLSFGYKLFRTTDPAREDLLRSLVLPGKGPNRPKIATSTEEIIFQENLIIDMMDDYEIEFYVEESGVKSKHKYEFEIPMPEQPYPSWRWDGVQWYCPGDFPMPPAGEDPQSYEWSETDQAWVKNVDDPEKVWDLPGRI